MGNCASDHYVAPPVCGKGMVEVTTSMGRTLVKCDTGTSECGTLNQNVNWIESYAW